MAEVEDSSAVGERGCELFLSGLNCAESVLLSNMERLGVQGDWVPRVSSGFGGGIARTCQVCGALTGSVMAFGWVRGRDSAEDSLDEVYRLGQMLVEEFTSNFGTTSCAMLIDVDLRDEEARKKARREGVFEQQCARYVEFCARRTAEMLSGDTPAV